MQKGITPVISIVLLLMVTIAIAGAAFIFLQSTFRGASETTSAQMETQLSAMSSCMNIEGVSFDKIYIRNCGQGALKGFSVYLDDEKINVIGDPEIGEGITGEISLVKGVSGNELKVSSAFASGAITMKHCDANKIAPAGLVGYWALDGSAADSSGLGNHGTIVGADCNVMGKSGTACSFDGASNKITINDSDVLSPTAQLTVSAWVYPVGSTPNDFQRIAAKSEAPDYGEYTLWKYNWGPVIWYVHNWPSGYIISNAALPLNTWTHVTGTFDSGTLKIYINGVPDGTGTTTVTSITASTQNLYIGNTGDGARGFSGAIDEAAVWNRALDENEIRQIYTRTC